jgi:hypothetical protein
VDELRQIILDSVDLVMIERMVGRFIQLESRSNWEQLAAERLGSLMSQLQQTAISSFSGSNMDAVLRGLNQGGSPPWQALVPSAFKPVAGRVFSGQPVASINFYQEISPEAGNSEGLGSYTDLDRFESGDVVDTNQYAGGFPVLRAIDYGGSAVVTVTGGARLPDGTLQTDRTWQASLSAESGCVNYTLAPAGSAPAPANSLIVSCVNIVPDDNQEGTLIAIAARPAGRPMIA